AVVAQRVHPLLPGRPLDGSGVGIAEDERADSVVHEHELVDAAPAAEARARALVAAARLVERRAVADVERLERIGLLHRPRKVAGAGDVAARDARAHALRGEAELFELEVLGRVRVFAVLAG